MVLLVRSPLLRTLQTILLPSPPSSSFNVCWSVGPHSATAAREEEEVLFEVGPEMPF